MCADYLPLCKHNFRKAILTILCLIRIQEFRQRTRLYNKLKLEDIKLLSDVRCGHCDLDSS